MNTKKILIITTELYPWIYTGPQNVTYNITNRLTDYFDIEMLCVEPPAKDEIYKHYSKKIKFHFVPKNKLSFLYQHSYYQKFKDLGNFDIIHFQNLPGGKMTLLPKSAKKKARKVILTIYDWIPYELKYYNFGNKIKHLVHWWLSKYTLKFFDHIVVESTFIKKVVTNNLRLISIPTSILPIGINCKDYDLSNIKGKILAGKNNLFFWGKLYEKKGVGHLIKAFKIVSQKDKQTHLYIAGKGGLERKYKTMTKQNGLLNKIHFLGFLNTNELKSYLKSANICILPSKYEGFGIAILEAMAAGKAVITSDKGGQTDFAKHNINSILINTLDYKLMAQEILKLISNKKKLQYLSGQAKLAAQRYDWDKIISQYINFYSNLE